MDRYFNTAGLGIPLAAARTAAETAAREFRELLFSEEGVERYQFVAKSCREALALLLQASDPTAIELLPNASLGLSLALHLVPLQPGAIILTSDQEHPAITKPLADLAAKGLTVIEISAEDDDDFIRQVDSRLNAGRVGLIVLSHVSYKDGRILPVAGIARLARSVGVPFIVDGAQAVGHIPVDLRSLDVTAYAFSGHKWLMAPMGTGGIWLNPSAHSDGGREIEVGTQNIGLIAGLTTAVRAAVAASTNRWTELRKQKQALAAALIEHLVPGSYAFPSWEGEYAPGILSLLLPDALRSWDVAAGMWKRHRIVVKPFKLPERPNAIRISLPPESPPYDIDDLARALREQISGK